jgi:hypothetical protein
MPSKYGDPCFLLHVDKDPKLAQACRGAGRLSMGEYFYELTENQKWIRKTKKGSY